MKQCKTCGKFEDIGRKSAVCKACTKIRNQSYYQSNKEKMIADAKKWRESNKEKYSEYMAERHKIKWPEYRKLVLEHYGMKCACCGESNPKFLSVDHINNDGNEHRAKMKHAQLYPWLVRNGFKCDFELQTLCFNCNFGKRYNGGTCPHHDTESSETIPQGSTPKQAEAHSTER